MPLLEGRSEQASSDMVAAAQAIMQRLAAAWNSADGTAFLHNTLITE